MIKIMIADDQELIRESLKIVLNMSPDMKVIATAENGIEAMESIKRTIPISCSWMYACPNLTEYSALISSKNIIHK